MGRNSGIHTSKRADVEVLVHMLCSGISKEERFLDVRNGYVKRDFHVIGLARYPETEDGIFWRVYLCRRGMRSMIYSHRGEFLQNYRLPMLIYDTVECVEEFDQLVEAQCEQLIGNLVGKPSHTFEVHCGGIGRLASSFTIRPQFFVVRTGVGMLLAWTDAIFHDRGAQWPFLWIGRVQQGDNWVFARAQLKASSSGVMLLF